MSLYQPSPASNLQIDLPARSPVASRLFIWASTVSLLALLFWLIMNTTVALPAPPALLTSEKLAWYLTRASGTTAYLLLSASTVWGLLLSTKVIKEWLPAPVALAMHNYLSWTAIGLSLLHAFVLLFDSYYTYTVANLLIPFTGPYEPGWVGAGIIGFYIMLLTSVSFYCRQWIGQKSWRKLHYFTFGADLLTTLHGWQAGTDSAQLAPIYWISLLLVAFLTLYRILDAWNRR
ncbi:MAG: hypothetical protein R2911_13270 [Caldilineaceae bacterium]